MGLDPSAATVAASGFVDYEDAPGTVPAKALSQEIR
jgi:hypothetical protein